MRILKALTLVAVVLVMILIFHNGPIQRAPQYNAAAEVEAEGVVQAVQQYWCPINRDEGTHLIMRTESGNLEVHVAPRRFLEGNGISFGRGDRVTIVGAMVVYQDHDALIARKITRGDQTFLVRQVDGRPLWVEHSPYFVR